MNEIKPKAREILATIADFAERQQQAGAETERAKAVERQLREERDRYEAKVEGFWWKHEGDLPGGLKSYQDEQLGVAKLNRFDKPVHPKDLADRLAKMKGGDDAVEVTLTMTLAEARELGLVTQTGKPKSKRPTVKLKPLKAMLSVLTRSMLDLYHRAGGRIEQGRSVTYTPISQPSSQAPLRRRTHAS